MLNAKRTFILLLLFGLGVCAYAQEPMPELKRTAAYYRSLDAFSLKVSVDFYTDESSDKPGKNMQGWAQVAGRLSHSMFDGKESVTGDDFVLVADHGNKAVYYSPREKNAKNKVSDGTEVLDSVFLSRYNVREKQVDDALSEYRLTPKKQGDEFTSVSIKVDRRQHLLLEILYIYNGDVKFKKVRIRYSGFKPSVDPSKTFFSEANFISGRQKTARLQPAYSQYQLINSFTYDPKKNLIEQ